jgi:hypothetical protein
MPSPERDRARDRAMLTMDGRTYPIAWDEEERYVSLMSMTSRTNKNMCPFCGKVKDHDVSGIAACKRCYERGETNPIAPDIVLLDDDRVLTPNPMKIVNAKARIEPGWSMARVSNKPVRKDDYPSFKVGDIIKGNHNNHYSHTNDKSTMEIVTLDDANMADSFGTILAHITHSGDFKNWMIVKILHSTNDEPHIGRTWWVKRERFALKKRMPTPQRMVLVSSEGEILNKEVYNIGTLAKQRARELGASVFYLTEV